MPVSTNPRPILAQLRCSSELLASAPSTTSNPQSVCCVFICLLYSFPAQQLLSKPTFFRQNSERRNFKLLDTRKLSRDGMGSPSKLSPPSTPSSPDDTFFNLGDPPNGRKKRKIPKVRPAASFDVSRAPHPPPRKVAVVPGQRLPLRPLPHRLGGRGSQQGGVSYCPEASRLTTLLPALTIF